MGFGGADHRGANGEKLDDMRTPAMVALVNLGANHTLSSQADSLGLHALHRQFACIVEGLGIISHFYVLPNLLEPLSHTLAGDVVDAVAHHHTYWTVTSSQQCPEILA